MPPPARPGLVVIIGRTSEAERLIAAAKPPDRPVPASKPIEVTCRREKTDDGLGETDREG